MANCENQSRRGRALLHKYSLPLWGPELHHHRQRDTIYRKKSLCFCEEFNIRIDWAAVAHPRTNRQVERANGMILQGLKP